MTEQLAGQTAEEAVPFVMELYAQKARLQLTGERELLSSGMTGVIRVVFTFSEDWAGLKKTAVFSNGAVSIDVPEDAWEQNGCIVPQQVLTAAGKTLMVGLFGTDGEEVALPTVWCSLGRVEPGAALSGIDAAAPEAPIWARLEKQIAELSLDNAASLTQAVNEALARARESGEFNGAPGEKGEKGDPGAQGPQGEKGDTGAAGVTGANGLDGGYYAPGVTLTNSGTMKVTFVPSKTGMEAIPDQSITLPQGPKGADGGYYTIDVEQLNSQNVKISFIPSKEGMETILPEVITLPQGPKGATPVRGTDYWTAADIAEIKSYVDEAILGGAW